MNKIENYVLPIHTNTLYEEEAISSIGLTRDVADKINELVDAYNELSEIDLKWKQEQEGTIRKGILYLKDNLFNTIIEVLKTAHFYDIMNEDTQALIIKRSEDLQKQIKALASGSPIPVTSVSQMTNTSKIYVNTSNGKWYFYNGETWVPVATYQATQINDNEITSDKRTVVGDYGYLFSEKGTVEINIDELSLTLNGTHMLIYRDHIITIGPMTLEIPSNEPYMLYFDTLERDLRWHRPSSTIHRATENCVYLGYVAISDGGYTQLNAPRYSVIKNGKKETYTNGTKLSSSRIADLLGGKVEVNTNDKKIKFTSAVYSLGTSYISLNSEITYDEENAGRIKYVVYDTVKKVVKVYENRNAENDAEILLFGFYQGKIYHSYVNRHLYTVNGASEGDPTDKLNGKKALFIGDSITRGAGSSKPFTTYLSEQTSLTVENVGEDGMTVTMMDSSNPENSICYKIHNLENIGDNDIIGVMGGTNDFWKGIYAQYFDIVGTALDYDYDDEGFIGYGNDYTSTNFYKSWCSIAEKLLEKAPGKFIFFMTPTIAYRSSERLAEGYEKFPYPHNGATTNTLNDYCEVIRKVGKKYSIPVLDMYSVSGLCSLIPSEDQRLYHDGVHPNEAGYEQMAKVIANFIEANYR